MDQPQQANNPWSSFSQMVGQAGFPGKGGNDGRTYIGTSPNDNTGAVNSLNNYTAPKFQQQPNPYLAYYAQQAAQRNPYAQTQFGQMPQQNSYYQGPFAQGGMGGKGGYGGGMGGKGGMQNPYTQNSGQPQSYIQEPPSPYANRFSSMGGKGGAGMGGKGA
jgi:hypothetical protein